MLHGVGDQFAHQERRDALVVDLPGGEPASVQALAWPGARGSWVRASVATRHMIGQLRLRADDGPGSGAHRQIRQLIGVILDESFGHHHWYTGLTLDRSSPACPRASGLSIFLNRSTLGILEARSWASSAPVRDAARRNGKRLWDMPDRSPSRDGLRLWAMVAEHAADRGRRVSVADACAVAVSAAHVSGAGLTVMTRSDSGRVVCVTDDVSARVEELQVTLGEGPCVDAYASRAPVLTPDLRGQQALRRWPAFAPAAKRGGRGRGLCVPAADGRRPSGCDGPVPPRAAVPRLRMSCGMRSCWPTPQPCCCWGARAGHDDFLGDASAGLLSEREGYRAEIDQATGMVSVQIGVNVDVAFLRLRAYAYAEDRSLTDVCRDVVARRLRFSADSGRRAGRRRRSWSRTVDE